MSFLVALIVALTLFVGSVGLASAATPIFVDTTTGDDTTCNGTAPAGAAPNCPVKTIQKGVDLVDVGGTVNVAAGTYTEQVTLNKAVTLNGANAGNDPRTGGDVRVAESIVDGETTHAAFVVNVSGVTIDGFTVTRGSGAVFEAGIYAGPTTSWQVLNNIITGNQKGIYALCGGTCTIRHNLFDGNNITGPAGAVSIYTYQTSGLTVDQNEFKNQANNATAIFDAAAPNTHQNLAFTANHVYDNTVASSAMVILGATNATVSDNRVHQQNGTALNFLAANNTVTVQNNDLSLSARGLRVNNVGAGVNANITVMNNSFAGNTTEGLGIVAGAYTGTLNAENNWWGDHTGPTNASNVDGTGSSVANGVDFTTWLCSGSDTSGAIGFQPNPGLTCPVAQPPISPVFVRSDGSNVGCNGSVDVAFSEAAIPNCALKRIGKGVEVVTAGGTVNVAAGTYAENVAIGKTVILKGANQGLDPRTGGNPRGPESIVDGGGISAALALGGSTNVVVDGFTIKGGQNGLATGVHIPSGTPGWQLLNNIITDNSMGVYANCGSGPCILSRNLFDANNRPGAAGGSGIYSEASNGLVVDQNEFRNHANNSPVIFAATGIPAHQNLNFSANSIHDNAVGSAVYVLGVDGGGFTVNEIVHPNGTAISLASGNTNVSLLNNKFAGSLRGVRVQNDGYGFPDNANIVVTDNAFGNNAEYGLNVVNGYVGTLNARRNWWGNANGPTNPANPAGTGAAVLGNVFFAPWLADGTDTSPAIGFQPNLTPLGSFAINVAPTTGLFTTESGGTASFSIVLSAAPTDTVTIGLTSSNTNEGTVAPASVTFTPANWNVPQTVTVTGVSVGPSNGDVPFTIVTAPATSTDPAFNGVDPADVAVVNRAATLPSLSIADAGAPEGNSGISQLAFTVTLSQASTRTVTVQYAASNGTAVVNNDYAGGNGTLTFNPGETTKTLTVDLRGDTAVEPDETFFVDLSNPNGATILRGRATGTIQSDDLPAADVCAPRPDITVQVQPIGGRRAQVTVQAGTAGPNAANVLGQIRFGTARNGSVQMVGQSSIGTDPIVLPAGTRQLVFVIQQTDPTQPVHVPFTITDSCGAVEKFVGGGKDAFGQ